MTRSAYSEMIYKVALSMLKGATPSLIRRMNEEGISPGEFFSLEKKEVENRLGLAFSPITDRYRRDEAIFMARKEMENIERHHIRCIFYGDDDYPWRMEEIPDFPILLYALGEAPLNAEHLLSVVGTRRCTAMGVDFTKKFLSELGGYFPDLCVVSGLAFGIDAAAHLAALDNGLATVGVVAHGLDTIYPAAHRDLAKRIIKAGGAIISEYPFGTSAYRGRFLERNRIVAALSDAAVIVESEIKGGAMSTANTAFNYNRDVYAVPGRVSDVMSSGCNNLIRRNKAHLLTCAADFVELSSWQPMGVRIEPGMRSLFPELEGDSKRVYDMLRFSQESKSVDAIHHELKIPMAALISLLSELEFDGIIVKLPGNRYMIGS